MDARDAKVDDLERRLKVFEDKAAAEAARLVEAENKRRQEEEKKRFEEEQAKAIEEERKRKEEEDRAKFDGMLSDSRQLN